MEQYWFPSLFRFVAVTNEFEGYFEEDAFFAFDFFVFCSVSFGEKRV
jgi:hypothetical protein